jgi:8-oxo-dGTP diphosphatase
MHAIDHISLIDIKNKQILLCVSKGKTKWQLPGGKREAGETDTETLIRECEEELGIKIEPNSIKFFDEIEGQAHSKDIGIMVKVRMYTADWTGELEPQKEIAEAKYMKFSEVPDTSEMGWVYLKNLQRKGFIK